MLRHQVPSERIEKLDIEEPYSKDYCKTYDDMVVAVSIKGMRSAQEDYLAIAIDEVKGFDRLSEKAQKFVLKSTFNKMQKKYGQAKFEGSTGCAAIASLDENQMIHVATANLGDSSAYLVILDADNRVVKSKRINTFHKPTDPSEEKRIKKDGGFVSLNRLNARLALSRAFGDTLQKGISHDCDVVVHPEEALLKDQKCYVIVASDGMDFIGEKIGNWFEGKNKSLVDIANEIAKNAIDVRDNCSVAIIPVTRIPASAAIFDGHGGSKVSNAIGEHFYEAFAKKIQLERVKQKAIKKSIKKAIEKNQGRKSLPLLLEEKLFLLFAKQKNIIPAPACVENDKLMKI